MLVHLAFLAVLRFLATCFALLLCSLLRCSCPQSPTAGFKQTIETISALELGLFNLPCLLLLHKLLCCHAPCRCSMLHAMLPEAAGGGRRGLRESCHLPSSAYQQNKCCVPRTGQQNRHPTSQNKPAVKMGRSTRLRALSMAATAAVVRGFFSPSSGGHCVGASPLSFAATTATSPVAGVSRGRSTSSVAWRPAGQPASARNAHLGGLRMVRSVAMLSLL